MQSAAGSGTAESGQGHLTGYGTFSYRTYVLLTLTLVYTLNFVDRILISVVGGPIIEEFQLTNFQFGILSGIGFALFYTLLGIPIASFSERYNRVRIIGICVILWSIATVLCGYSVGFLTLLLARLAVGVGEAGCTPPANSIITDYYKPLSRPTALGIYAMGITIGGVLAQVFGGWIVQNFTWREAFIYVGAPGVLVGILVLMTIKEPPRGYTEPPGAKIVDKLPFRDAVKEIFSKRTFWMMSAGATLAAFAGYSLVGFQPLYIQYVFGYTAGETAIRFMAILGLMGTLGAFLGGFLTEKATRFSPSAGAWVPGLALLACFPIYAAGFLVDAGVAVMFGLFLIANLFQYFYLSAQYNIATAVVSVRARATSVAILLFIANLIGYGAGPPVIGSIADFLTTQAINSSAYADILTNRCSVSVASAGEELAAACRELKGIGIRQACALATAMFGVAGVCFLICARTFVKDRWSNAPAT
ncbi:spinster family MFS transporter [Hyphomonas sp.]|uniref:spinster family MFS transporter n=1 Tax=Hyphomonas sp. TaxID=87 RepID=UPI00391928D4